MAKYRVKDSASEELRAVVPHYSALTQDLLFGRGLVSSEDIARFMSPDFMRDSHDPFLLPDMEVAVERIVSAVRGGESVVVWSDYDCDGVPGGVLLTQFLQEIGAKVEQYIPHRHLEGFGLNEAGISALAQKGVTLIITVDLGTSDVGPVAHAKALGIDVIVTDHHEPPEELPLAFALINPKRKGSEYPFNGLCGAGVAWKLLQGVLARNRFGMSEGREKWFLDLVAIGTLADMVPLVDENRMLATFGLLVMRRNRRPGLAALLSLLRIKPELLTEDDIGFMIAPRVNAASRMDSPDLAAALLSAKTLAEAKVLAKKLSDINDERKVLVATTVREANKRMAEWDNIPPVIVMGSPHWRPGILGLVANSLMEAHNRPVYLWGREGGELLRGSCRSASVSVVDIMTPAADIFAHFGGHHGAGGFALEEGRAHELPKRLIAVYESMQVVDGEPAEVLIDRELSLAEVPQARRELARLAPFGMSNHKPLFLFPRVSLASVRVFGKKKDHLSFSLRQGSFEIESIAFFSTPESFTTPPVAGMEVSVVGHVETDWKGGPRVRVVDIL